MQLVIRRLSKADGASVFSNDLDRAVILDVHDATADSLAIGQVDEDAIPGLPAGSSNGASFEHALAEQPLPRRSIGSLERGIGGAYCSTRDNAGTMSPAEGGSRRA